MADAIADTMRGHSQDGADGTRPRWRCWAGSGLPDSEEFGRRFPHQLSGGQQQRVCIAAALASNPKVLVLDEPTTGLDVVTQARILNELLRLREEEHVAMLYVTHDLAVAAHIADRIVVMYGGYIVEEGPAEEVLRRPRHPYTRGLMAATPDHVVARVLEVMPGAPVDIADRPPGCPFAPRCPQKVEACDAELPVLELHGDEPLRPVPRVDADRLGRLGRAGGSGGAGGGRPQQARDPEGQRPLRRAPHAQRERDRRERDLVRHPQRRVRGPGGRVGSGKTTIARVIAGLHPTWTGQVLLDGEPLAAKARSRTRDQRRRVQMVFQSPTDALNPRHSVSDILSRPTRVLRGLSRAAAAAEVATLLEAVRLPSRYADRYPRELSGGQRQRVAIARALAADPDVIICDEITSALDVSVQARILELLRDLRQERGLSLLFITHDLGIVATIADEVLVLDQGLICESGKTKTLLASPRNDYTKQLLHSAPSLIDSIGAWDASEA